MTENEISNKIIGAAIEVHRALGPGLLDSVYRQCLQYELQQLSMECSTEVVIPAVYKDLEIDTAYRLDILVMNKVIIELKVVESLLPVHRAQLLSYLRLTGMKLGLLINFNVAVLKDGMLRIVNNL